MQPLIFTVTFYCDVPQLQAGFCTTCRHACWLGGTGRPHPLFVVTDTFFITICFKLVFPFFSNCIVQTVWSLYFCCCKVCYMLRVFSSVPYRWIPYNLFTRQLEGITSPCCLLISQYHDPFALQFLWWKMLWNPSIGREHWSGDTYM